jgi:CRISPR/Cas system-associated protein Cas10 (large subunit of type III CRISPR-Cas system)
VQQFLLKIDLSGIQHFIFDVPSKGAARELKGRSFYIIALSRICQTFLEQQLNQDLHIVYDGGGNTFAYVQADQTELDEAIDALQAYFAEDEIFPVISYVAVEERSFREQMAALGQSTQSAKYQRKLAFTPSPVEKLDGWRKFTKGLIYAKGFQVSSGHETALTVTRQKISKAGIAFQLTDEDHTFKDRLTNKLPVDEQGDLALFDTIATQAKGAQKLAALKMDVDNLGALFAGKEREDYDTLSQGLKAFFEERLYELTRPAIQGQELYPLFAGGDDLFLIGTWNVILSLAQQINEAFMKYQQTWHQYFAENEKPLTLSAGITIFSPNFPMMRISSLAEEALEEAKSHEGKNRITLFGHALTWKEYEKTQHIAETLIKLIENHGESKGLLTKIANSAIGYEKLQDRAESGQIAFPKVWRLKYYLKDVQSNNRETIESEIFKQYEDALIQAYANNGANGSHMNPQVFPIAARWAELALRNDEAVTEY